MYKVLFPAVILGLAACDGPKPSSGKPSPTPSASSVAASPAATVAESSVAGTGPVEVGVVSEEVVNLDAGNDENRLIKAEVLARIDTIPGLSDDDKDRLYVQVERARGMGKLLTIPFPSGAKAPSAADITALKTSLALPQFQSFLEDPSVVFVVLGFADKKGDAELNLKLSRSRAEAVVTAMKERCGILNVTHAVGMGSSEFFDSANLDKNRVVEVWAVLP
ncbi:MAG: hypothetical protein Fur0032_07060 [Terrimicrobiaceae bacterium]